MQGVDLEKLIATLPAYRAFNVIDSIVVEEAIRNAEANEGLEKARTMIYKVYNSNGTSNDEYGGSLTSAPRDRQPTPKTEQTDDGFVGLEPPIG